MRQGESKSGAAPASTARCPTPALHSSGVRRYPSETGVFGTVPNLVPAVGYRLICQAWGVTFWMLGVTSASTFPMAQAIPPSINSAQAIPPSINSCTTGLVQMSSRWPKEV